MFKDAKEKTEPRPATPEGGLSIIAAGTKIVGDIESTGLVRVEGRVEGTIRCARQVLVGRQGSVKGDIETREAVIGGMVHGTVTGAERVEIQSTAKLTGDIRTKSIVVVEGGTINGTVRMEENITLQRTPAAPASSGKHDSKPPQPVAVVR